MKSLIRYINEQKGITTVFSTEIDGKVMKIQDIENYKNSGNTARAIETDNVYYSVIYKDKKISKQPEFTEIQNFINNHVKDNPMNNVLVLGAAGCTIPRYLLLTYPEVNVTSIEYSADLVDIANKYFLSDLSKDDLNRHELINSDAFEFIKTVEDNKYDCVVVDIFDDDKLLDEIFSKSFTNDLKRVTTDNAIIIYSLLMTPEDEAIKKLSKNFDEEKIEFRKTDAQNVAGILK